MYIASSQSTRLVAPIVIKAALALVSVTHCANGSSVRVRIASKMFYSLFKLISSDANRRQATIKEEALDFIVVRRMDLLKFG